MIERIGRVDTYVGGNRLQHHGPLQGRRAAYTETELAEGARRIRELKAEKLAERIQRQRFARYERTRALEALKGGGQHGEA